MIQPTSSLPDILDHVWGLLVRGGADKKHAFHYPSLATFGEQGIQQRTVVLRKALKPERQLISYSDQRTQKIADLQQLLEGGWLFYDHGSKEQIRARSIITLHHQDQLAQKHFDAIPPAARGDYLGPVAPGTPSEAYTDNLPPHFKETANEENTQKGFGNFMVLIAQVIELDYLKLRREGHLRTQFHWQEDAWQGSWVAP
ncbi:MAG: hypothetical protein WA960_13860 [Tunicatimonas sp.]